MSNRELVVLGTASQAPTRSRNHNGYFLRWESEGILFDPGEGTQRQMLLAGITTSQVHRICVTHFHGDHSLGLPGVIQRISLDRVAHEVHAYFPGVLADGTGSPEDGTGSPEDGTGFPTDGTGSRSPADGTGVPADGTGREVSGQAIFRKLRYATLYHDQADIREHPVETDGLITATKGFRLEARKLDHLVPTVGYRLVEPDGRRMLPDKLAAHGIEGPDIGHLQRDGRIVTRSGATVAVEEVSEPRPGQKFAFVMDTRLCDAAFELADHADMLVCESTFADSDADLAREYGHLTAGQAGRIAHEAGVRTLVLTHFSQRYESDNSNIMTREAAGSFGGMIVSACDLDRIPVPARRPSPGPGQRPA